MVCLGFTPKSYSRRTPREGADHRPALFTISKHTQRPRSTATPMTKVTYPIPSHKQNAGNILGYLAMHMNSLIPPFK